MNDKCRFDEPNSLNQKKVPAVILGNFSIRPTQCNFSPYAIFLQPLTFKWNIRDQSFFLAVFCGWMVKGAAVREELLLIFTLVSFPFHPLCLRLSSHPVGMSRWYHHPSNPHSLPTLVVTFVALLSNAQLKPLNCEVFQQMSLNVQTCSHWKPMLSSVELSDRGIVLRERNHWVSQSQWYQTDTTLLRTTTQ